MALCSLLFSGLSPLGSVLFLDGVESGVFSCGCPDGGLLLFVRAVLCWPRCMSLFRPLFPSAGWVSPLVALLGPVWLCVVHTGWA